MSHNPVDFDMNWVRISWDIRGGRKVGAGRWGDPWPVKTDIIVLFLSRRTKIKSQLQCMRCEITYCLKEVAGGDLRKRYRSKKQIVKQWRNSTNLNEWKWERMGLECRVLASSTRWPHIQKSLRCRRYNELPDLSWKKIRHWGLMYKHKKKLWSEGGNLEVSVFYYNENVGMKKDTPYLGQAMHCSPWVVGDNPETGRWS